MKAIHAQEKSTTSEKPNESDLWMCMTINIAFCQQGRELAQKNELKWRIWEEEGGKKRFVQTWQWVNRALLITVCNPSWVDAGGCLTCCCVRRHAGKKRKVIGFYCSPNSWHLTQFCVWNPQSLDLCLSVFRTSNYTKTPLRNGVEFVPSLQSILYLSRSKQRSISLLLVTFNYYGLFTWTCIG